MRLVCRLSEMAGELPVAASDARRRWTTRASIRLELDDGEGHIGQGEAAPLPDYSLDDLEGARAALEAVAASPIEVREDAPTSGELARLFGSVEAASARCALETALLDLVGQREGVPVHRLLGATTPAPVALSALLPLGDVDRMLAAAEAEARSGITRFKLKIGVDLERELASIARFRREGGDGYALRLDANGTLPEAHAMALLARLAELEPEYVEEPMPLEALLRLEGRSPLPLALDESLIPEAAEPLAARALGEGLVHALVLKPMALGGPLRCLRLAALAAEHGAGSSVSHLYEGPVAHAAHAELALALERPLAAGLAPHPGLALAPELRSPAYRDGRIEPHDAPGGGRPPQR
jgi:o-succinylbenzoate synthase